MSEQESEYLSSKNFIVWVFVELVFASSFLCLAEKRDNLLHHYRLTASFFLNSLNFPLFQIQQPPLLFRIRRIFDLPNKINFKVLRLEDCKVWILPAEYRHIRYPLIFFDCLVHPNLSAIFATDLYVMTSLRVRLWAILHISGTNFLGFQGIIKNQKFRIFKES